MSASMEGGTVYLDNASTTKPYPEVVRTVVSILEEDFGNPSSLHGMGAKALRVIDDSRSHIALAIGADPKEIYFTSGGTEANNWAISSAASPASHIVSTQVEHPSVLAYLERLEKEGHRVSIVGVDAEGRVDPDRVLKAVTPETSLVSVMLVQNEMGTIQPVREIGLGLKALRRKPKFHVDAVQGFARLHIDVHDWGIDMLSMSAHKIGGMKGAGALFVRKGVKPQPMFWGGGQERELRSGTENVPGIAAFGTACQVWERERDQVMERTKKLRLRLIKAMENIEPDVVLNGPRDKGVAPYIVNMSFPGLGSEMLLHALEAKGVYVSAGSACSSHKKAPSGAILALGKGQVVATSSIRFSMGRTTTAQDIDRAAQATEDSLAELRAWRRRK